MLSIKSSYKKYFCVLILFMMFCAVVSSGCGGVGGGSDSSGGNNNNNNNNRDNGDNGNNDSPVEISGTWTIESGRAVLSDDDRTIKLTYAPGRIGEVGVEITKNNNNYGIYSGLYSLTFSGEYVFAHVEGTPGTGALNVDYSYDDYPDSKTILTFIGNIGFSYIGNGTYEKTQETIIIQFH